MRKKNLLVLYGGRSTEHEVSIVSAEFVLREADKTLFKPLPVKIGKDGRWKLTLKYPLSGSKKTAEVFPVPYKRGAALYFFDGVRKPLKIDAVFPVLHGPLGEDGTVQGLFRILNVPFVGSGVLSSSISMDKEASKKLLEQRRLPVCKYLSTNKIAKNKLSFEQAKKELGLPMFVKPSNAGSSVGVGKIKNRKDFIVKTREAFKYGEKVIYEECVRGREIECAVLGNENAVASVPGEIIVSTEFYSYEAKYILKDAAKIIYPADITPAISEKIRVLALKAFEALYCEGMARVDFFLKDEKIYINEVNTIPGFTSISMYPKLWEASGIKPMELITRLVELACQRHKKENSVLTEFKAAK